MPPDSASGIRLPPGAADLRLDPRLEVTSGLEFEGTEQSFGFQTWLDPSVSAEDVSEIGDLSLLRNHDSDAQLFGRLGIRAGPAPESAWNPQLSLEARWGVHRRSLYSEGEALCAAGTLKGLSVRNHLQIEHEDEEAFEADAQTGEASSGQDLVQARWRRALGTGWDYVVRGTLDLSWADEKGSDSLAALASYLMDYRKVSAGIGVASTGVRGGSVYLDFSRKSSSEYASTSYDAGVLQALYGGLSEAAVWSIESRTERRSYPTAGDSLEAYSSALRSYWETEVRGAWQRFSGGIDLEAALDVTGTRYDPFLSADSSITADDDLGSLNADRLRLEGEFLAGRDLLVERAAPESVSWLESLKLGAGLTGERLWLDGDSGDYASWGGKVELGARGGPPVGGGWLEIAAEAGRRDYRGSEGDLVFDIGGFSFSFAQTDYIYLELSLIGGGRLPWALEWEIFGFLQQEQHSDGEEDARLSSLNLALTRRWPLVR